MSEKLYTIGKTEAAEPARSLDTSLLLIEPSFPAAQAVISGVIDECRKSPGIFKSDPRPSVLEDNVTEGALTLLVYDQRVTIKKMGAPFSEDVLEVLTSKAWWWPEAAEWTASHLDHLRISIADRADNQVFDALILSVVTVAVIRLTNSAGVIWTAADRLCSSEEFETAMMECRGNDPILPVSVWIETQAGVDEDDDTSMLYTSGMEALGLPDIEIQGSTTEPVDLVVMVSPLLDFIVSEGAVLEDGATIDLDENTQARVRYGPSMLDEDSEVLILELP